jgi:hypothetical protein
MMLGSEALKPGQACDAKPVLQGLPERERSERDEQTNLL